MLSHLGGCGYPIGSPRPYAQLVAGRIKAVSIRHADPAELERPTDQEPEARAQLHEWWNHWETLPTVVRDRSVAEVLAEERISD
jgi:hypothetical protein